MTSTVSKTTVGLSRSTLVSTSSSSQDKKNSMRIMKKPICNSNSNDAVNHISITPINQLISNCIATKLKSSTNSSGKTSNGDNIGESVPSNSLSNGGGVAIKRDNCTSIQPNHCDNILSTTSEENLLSNSVNDNLMLNNRLKNAGIDSSTVSKLISLVHKGKIEAKELCEELVLQTFVDVYSTLTKNANLSDKSLNGDHCVDKADKYVESFFEFLEQELLIYEKMKVSQLKACTLKNGTATHSARLENSDVRMNGFGYGTNSIENSILLRAMKKWQQNKSYSDCVQSSAEKLFDKVADISAKMEQLSTNNSGASAAPAANSATQAILSTKNALIPTSDTAHCKKIINFMTPGAMAHYPGPNGEKLSEILDRTGYCMELSNGQRKFGLPFNVTGCASSTSNSTIADSIPNGSEIFVGKIPKEIFEDELIPLFETIGEIFDLRLMIDPITGFSRGYAFITFFNKENAQLAVEKFDNYEIRKGKPIKVNISVPNVRLFIGNIPKEMNREDIFQEFQKHTTGLVDVILYHLPNDRKRNRGFCFVEYESHKHASQAKRKLMIQHTKIWGAEILVDWAEPLEEPDEETMSKVKVLYVRNLSIEMTEDQIKEIFQQYGPVERVKKIKDYAFVHFEERKFALDAMERLNGKEIGDSEIQIEISLAKPPSDKKKKEEILRNRERRLMNMMQTKSMFMYSNFSPILATSPAHSYQQAVLSASTCPSQSHLAPTSHSTSSNHFMSGQPTPGAPIHHSHHHLTPIIPALQLTTANGVTSVAPTGPSPLSSQIVSATVQDSPGIAHSSGHFYHGSPHHHHHHAQQQQPTSQGGTFHVSSNTPHHHVGSSPQSGVARVTLTHPGPHNAPLSSASHQHGHLIGATPTPSPHLHAHYHVSPTSNTNGNENSSGQIVFAAKTASNISPGSNITANSNEVTANSATKTGHNTTKVHGNESSNISLADRSNQSHYHHHHPQTWNWYNWYDLNSWWYQQAPVACPLAGQTISLAGPSPSTCQAAAYMVPNTHSAHWPIHNDGTMVGLDASNQVTNVVQTNSTSAQQTNINPAINFHHHHHSNHNSHYYPASQAKSFQKSYNSNQTVLQSKDLSAINDTFKADASHQEATENGTSKQTGPTKTITTGDRKESKKSTKTAVDIVKQANALSSSGPNAAATATNHSKKKILLSTQATSSSSRRAVQSTNNSIINNNKVKNNQHGKNKKL